VNGVEDEYFKSLRTRNIQGIKKSQGFVHNMGNMYGITELNSGDLITNKLFYKFTPEELVQLGIDEEETQEEGFNKIVLYNFSNDGRIYDVFEMLTEMFGTEITEITLFQLIEFLTGMGTENLILIDLSCSVFRREDDKKMTERETRHTRRNLNKVSIYGGRKNQKRQKTKKYKKARK
jgi:hypothetical protein